MVTISYVINSNQDVAQAIIDKIISLNLFTQQQHNNVDVETL